MPSSACKKKRRRCWRLRWRRLQRVLLWLRRGGLAVIDTLSLHDALPICEKRLREIYGERVAVMPYVMAGFKLAAHCAREFPKQASDKTVGMVLEIGRAHV